MMKINEENIRLHLIGWEDYLPETIKESFHKSNMDWIQQWVSPCKRFCLSTTQASNLSDENGIGWNLHIDNSRMEGLGNISVETIEQVKCITELYKDY